MKVSIGILAYNEENLIENTLRSLSQQSLFRENQTDLSIELIVVPNGCTDNTEVIAQKSLDLYFGSFSDTVSYRVCPLKQPGKANAWNVFVHSLSDSSSDYLILMDGDILFNEVDTLTSMMVVFDKFPQAWVAVDKPVKDINFQSKRTLLDRLSLLASSLSGGKYEEEKPAWLCGQLYCAKAFVLRKNWLPSRLTGEDSFLYTMITTDGLQVPVCEERIILAKGASHCFEAYTNLGRLLRHERWLILSNAFNEMIYEFLKADGEISHHVGSRIQELNETEDEWLSRCLVEVKAAKGYWLIPDFTLKRRFVSLKNKSIFKQIVIAPLAVAAFFVDLILAVQANFELHRKNEVRYWGK